MRTLFACTGLYAHGGIQRFNRNLLQSWSDLGFEVDTVALSDSAPPPMQWSSSRVYCARGDKARWLATLARLIASRRYDQYVCGHIHLAPALVSMLTLRGVSPDRCTLILHGIEVWGRLKGLKRLAAERFGQVLAVSRYTAESFLEQIRAQRREHVHVFPNTINAELRSHTLSGPESVNSPISLLSVGRLARTERDKGILDVLAALAGLPEQLPVRYVIVGDGDDRSFIESRARELALADRVVFRGALSDADLWSAYEQADVFVLPSAKEGFGIVFLEAMHFGLPVIAAREKGALDVVREGENGFLVEFGDVPALRQRLIDLSSDPRLRTRLGAAGRALVAPGGEFSFEAFRDRCLHRFGRVRDQRPLRSGVAV